MLNKQIFQCKLVFIKLIYYINLLILCTQWSQYIWLLTRIIFCFIRICLCLRAFQILFVYGLKCFIVCALRLKDWSRTIQFCTWWLTKIKFLVWTAVNLKYICLQINQTISASKILIIILRNSIIFNYY